MQITSTTLRRIIKEELDAVMSEDRAEHVAGIEAKIKRLEAEVERAQERRDEIGSDPAHENPGLSKTYRELGVRIENMEDKLDTLRKQRAELSVNEAAPKPTHRGKVKNKDGRVGMVSNTRKDKFGLMMTVVYRDGKTPKQETLYASDLEVA
jgi:chromosome segregation ATPase